MTRGGDGGRALKSDGGAILISTMPIITIKIIEDIFTPDQKAEMIHEVTEAMVKVTGEEKRNGNWVLVEEVKVGDWAIGGKPVVPPPS